MPKLLLLKVPIGTDLVSNISIKSIMIFWCRLNTHLNLARNLSIINSGGLRNFCRFKKILCFIEKEIDMPWYISFQ